MRAHDHDLIQRIYDASIDRSRYREVLQEIAERTGVYGAMVFDCTRDQERRTVGIQFLSSVYDPAAIAEYAEQNNDSEVEDQDRFADLSSTGNEINLIHDSELYTGNYTQRENVAAMRRRGVGGRFGALLSKEVWNTRVAFVCEQRA